MVMIGYLLQPMSIIGTAYILMPNQEKLSYR